MRVLGIGHCTLDQFAVVERFPEPDFKTEMSQFSVQGGGSVATATVALSRWGVDGTSFVGKVGDDERGRQIVHTIQNEGVDTSGMIVQPKAVSQLSFIVAELSTGKKQTYCTDGSVDPISASDVDIDAYLEGVDILLVDGTNLDAELTVMKAARERDITIILDASSPTQRIHEAVAYCDYLVASERFASQFAGVGQLKSLCKALLKKGPSTVIVTLGDEGCVGMSASEPVMIREKTFEVEVVDTTGAGDVFHAGVIYGVLQDWGLEKTLRFANIAAALTCRGIGGRGPIPALDEVISHL